MNALKSSRGHRKVSISETTVPVLHDGVEIKLGGRVYIMPALHASASRRYWERIEALKAHTEPDPMGLTVSLVTACLSRNYPEIDEDWVGAHLDMDNWEVMSAAVFGRGAFRRWADTQGTAGNVPAPQSQPKPAGTGAPSMPASPPPQAGDTPTLMP